MDAEHLTLIGGGVFHTPLVQGLLAAYRLERMRQSRAAGHESAGMALDVVAS